LPVLTAKQIKTFTIPAKTKSKLRIALSHEFIELYRGDKDLRIGKLLCDDYDCEVVHLGTDIASPADSRVFKSAAFQVEQVGDLPENYYLLQMKTKLIYHRRGNISLGGFFRYTHGIVRQLLRWKPDLIFENPFLTLTPRSYMTFIAAKILGIPLVYIDCGDIMPKLTLKHKLSIPFEKKVINNAAAVITYNVEGKKRFINKYGYPPEKIYVIPKPIDTQKFNPHVNCENFRKKHKLDGRFVVAYFGRLCSNKGARHLLGAADILRRRGADKDIAFLFVGGNIETDQATEFKAYLNKLNLNNIVLTGMIPNKDIPQAYTAADMAVFPDVTNLPGFSTALAESMASGIPIVIGNRGWEDATPIVDGLNGLVIEHASPEQIADSIELLKGNHNLRLKLAENALQYAQQEMDYDRVTEKYYNIFSNLLNNRTATRIKSDVGSSIRETEKAAV
jgi:glycosyltransferase involved in cell wall biosynthesis